METDSNTLKTVTYDKDVTALLVTIRLRLELDQSGGAVAIRQNPSRIEP
jgi:hypothetical protein